MTTRQRDGRLTTLDDLLHGLAVRRADIRFVVSALHREGYLDALRMRVTLKGFAVGQALAGSELPPLRSNGPLARRAA
jgi:hypothetical protein